MKKILVILLSVICLFGCSKKEEAIEQVEEKTIEKETFDVDISFTSNTMAYATLENIKENPDEYIGKSFKMKGQYRKFYSEFTGSNYYVCIIFDPAGCCSLGMEFMMDSEEAYPMEGLEIVVQGVIDSYQEGSDSFLYLKDASWKRC